ncbi:uncharacterized protein LOC113362745 isoform X2 [Papaver somniferum]|uniref:uncharacterized protein LOC113362745 isoform X2 n=1 Tax=Papaver somniferum TaxID=3469 RepID=UPI000E704346|nr:uncharacterized protein LOC113362745 isoform X2 [Papaver somniferum]
MNFFFEDRAMDFHSLTRRQLQSLCKKNKIPANMTNVAMADALSSLTTVEGIEDVGKSMPETPLTTRKTTTARKPVKRETDLVSNSVARPNRAPLTGKPSGSQIIIPSTPATRSCRKKVTGALVSRRSVCKIEEDSDVGEEVPVVDNVYSTRRSTILQHKSGVKVSVCDQKVGGGRNDTIKIEMLSEEENDGDTKSEVTSDVQQENDVVKIEMVSIEEDESKAEVTSDVQQNNDAKIEMFIKEENDEEIKSQSEVTSEIQQTNEGIKVEVLKEEQDVDSGNLSNTLDFVELFVLEKSRDLEEFPVDSDGDQDATSEGSSSALIMREVSRDNISEALDGCISEVSSAPMISTEESMDIALHKSSPVEEETEQSKYQNEHQSMVSEDQPMEINEVVDSKGAKDLEKFIDENELSDVKVIEVISENLEDLNVDEGNCKLTSEVELYDVKGTEVCTSEVSFAPVVSVEESMDIADVLSKASLMGENFIDKNEDQNIESENQSLETYGVETGVTSDLELMCTHKDDNSGVRFTEVEAIYTDGSSTMVVKTENLGNRNEVVAGVKAALGLESKFTDENVPSDVKFTEVEDTHSDVSSPMVEITENLEDSNVVFEVNPTSDLNLKYVDEEELGDFKVTKVDAFYADESSPMMEKTENLEDSSMVAEVKAAPDLDLKFVDEDELSDVNVSDVEAIYADESSPMVEETDKLDTSNVVVEFKATPDLELKFVDENELSDVKVSEVEATYSDESSLMVEKAENLEDSNAVVETTGADDLELKFIDEDELTNAKLAEAQAIYADASSPMVEKTENLENPNVEEGKSMRIYEASKAEEFESLKGSMKEVMSSLEDKKCNIEAQQEDILLVLTEVEAAINHGSEIQLVGLEKSDSISDYLEMAAILDDDWLSDNETSSYESEDDFDTKAPNPDTMEEMEDTELDAEEEISAAAEENEDCSRVDISNAVEEYSISPSVNNPTVNETVMSVTTPTKTIALENVVRGTTPLKSSTKKNAATTPRSFIIFNESKEINESGKLGARSTSKVADKIVPIEKENTGESTAQRKLKATSVRQLKKMIKQLTLKDNKNTIVEEQVHLGKKPALQYNKKTTIKVKVGKRAALQQLSDNCLADEKQK